MKSTSADRPEQARPTAPESLWLPGQQVGAWTLRVRLHTGAGSEVWGATGRGVPDVALKRLSGELLFDDGARGRFVDDARISSLLAHPNLCRLVLWDVEGPVPWLAFERLYGVPLTRVMTMLRERSTTMPIRVAAWLASQAARGLQAAHETRDEDGHFLSVVHRDVCPDNLFVTVRGEVRVLDFGIATARARVARTVTGQLRGRLAWAAPEQVRGAELDARADQFSLGAVLFALLTGKPLVEGQGAEELLKRLTIDEAPFARADVVSPRVPAELADVVARMVERNAERRYESMLEVALALEAIAGEEKLNSAQLAALVVPLTDLSPETSRAPRPWWALASIAAAIVTVIGVMFLPTASPSPAPVETPKPVAVVTAPMPVVEKVEVAPSPTPVFGQFAFVTRPASTVYWQGRKLGATPLELSLPAGKQRLKLVDETTQRLQWVTVDVKAGRGPRMDLQLE